MAQIKVNVKNMVGEAIADAQIALNLGTNGIVAKITDAEGNTSVSGIAVGDLPISITKEPYQKQDITLKIETDDAVVQKNVILLNAQTTTKVEDDVTKVVSTVVDTAVTEVVSAFVFKEPTTFGEAKALYKSLEDNINNQKNVVEASLKAGLTDVFQQQASNLVYVLSSQLQKSMDYYVSARSGISPFSSWSNTEKWAKYTSMIAGIYLIRKSLVSYVNKLTEKLVDTL